MNEIAPDDTTDYAAKPPMAVVIGVLALFHFVCCALPPLILSSVSLVTLLPSGPVMVVLLILLVAFVVRRVSRPAYRRENV